MNSTHIRTSPDSTKSDLSGATTIVVGASRGLGRGIATAFAEADARVVAVSRTAAEFPEPAGGGTIRAEVTDAGGATAAASLLDRYQPQAVILVAGASTHMAPLQEQTWETFSVNWHTDVQIAFHWLLAALLKPLRPGARMIVISSGAAINGSPLSGGYAGAKATQRFITGYARDEARRAGLDIIFSAVLLRITPMGEVGRPAIEAYAARAGHSVVEHVEQIGRLVTPEIAGAASWSGLSSSASPPLPRPTSWSPSSCAGCGRGKRTTSDRSRRRCSSRNASCGAG